MDKLRAELDKERLAHQATRRDLLLKVSLLEDQIGRDERLLPFTDR